MRERERHRQAYAEKARQPEERAMNDFVIIMHLVIRFNGLGEGKMGFQKISA